MPVRKSDIFFLLIAGGTILLFLIMAHGILTERKGTAVFRDNAELIRQYGLTDLCLFTEASYTRHLSQADLHTAFQDSPMAFEHFPSGAIAMPPKTLRILNERTD